MIHWQSEKNYVIGIKIRRVLLLYAKAVYKSPGEKILVYTKEHKSHEILNQDHQIRLQAPYLVFFQVLI